MILTCDVIIHFHFGGKVVQELGDMFENVNYIVCWDFNWGATGGEIHESENSPLLLPRVPISFLVHATGAFQRGLGNKIRNIVGPENNVPPE